LSSLFVLLVVVERRGWDYCTSRVRLDVFLLLIQETGEKKRTCFLVPFPAADAVMHLLLYHQNMRNKQRPKKENEKEE
jgi:hypothetical protein